MSTATPYTPIPVELLTQSLDRLAELRRETPVRKVVYTSGQEAWVVLSHDLARRALQDQRLSRARLVSGPMPYRGVFPEFLKSTLLFKDPPEHTRLRRLVAKFFTLRRVETLRASIQALADRLLDELERSGPPADLMENFAIPLPINVLTDLLGVPYADRARFIGWSRATLSTSGMTAEQSAKAIRELRDYLTGIITEKRSRPHDDLISALVMASDRDESLTDDEILPIAMVLIVGGFENTANMIGAGVYALLRHPEQLEVLRADVDGTIPTATEEILRHARQSVGLVPESAGVPYLAVEDIEVGGVTIRAGEAVAVHRVAANHDEAAFSDPDVFDVTREHNPHLGFSYGVHHCLGAQLARLELQVAFASLIVRFPHLALAGEPRYHTGLLNGPMAELPLTW